MQPGKKNALKLKAFNHLESEFVLMGKKLEV